LAKWRGVEAAEFHEVDVSHRVLAEIAERITRE
jgi:hypothetical protein